MRYPSCRCGSALLIVLGMMAFIIVSAVAFSAYMRASRLPSSYLRRTSASRLLAKAALAEAIEEIDAAIGNNQHPGVGIKEYKYPRTTGERINRNLWVEHVYIGSTNQNSSALSDNLVSPDLTVATLSVEALAYIPPAIINEVRYYSRRSTAACWHDLGFDSGRYAFCAVDVSDCLDINAITAGSGLNAGSEREIPAGRNSSDTGRITLAHTFEKSDHTGYKVNPADWDKFMDNYLTDDGKSDGSKVPLVSVADFNLAVNSKKPKDLQSPFCEFIKNGSEFVKSETGDDAELMRGQMFVTDSLFSSTNNANSKVKGGLANDKNQPFYGFPDKENDNDLGVDELLSEYNNDFVKEYVVNKKIFGDPEFIQLYDYLDVDSVPTSLALPTVERTPMITGVMLDADELSVSVLVENQEKQVGTKEKYDITLYKVKMSGSLNVYAGFVFPFKYDHEATKPKFKAQAAATIAFVPKTSVVSLRRGDAKAPMLVNWGNSKVAPTVVDFNKSKVVTAVSDPKEISSIKNKILEEEDAVIQEMELSLGNIDCEFVGDLPNDDAFNPSTICTFGVSQKKKLDSNGAWINDGDPKQLVGMPPVNAELSGTVDTPDSTTEFVPVVQVWVRILDSGNKVVDLVPACAADDAKPSEDVLSSEVNAGSAVRPLLRFADKGSFAFKYSASDASAVDGHVIDILPKAYITDDPRFNYAPENFITLDSAPSSVSQEWFDKQRSADNDRDGDGDIFMAVSDAGYLQSIYEFANLLNISGFTAGSWGVLANNRYDGIARADFAYCPANDAMWRTYSQCNLGSGKVDIARLFADLDNGGKGFRINPFTSSKSIMLAALANTPIDWWSASTNDQHGVAAAKAAKKKQLSGISESDKYTFSEHDGAQITVKHKVFEDLADEIMTRFKDNPDVDWQDAFDGLDWASDPNGIGGKDFGVSLHSVDKKFLHGFWRGCFAARQQLFLVFVRAEPLMMGGGAGRQAPPQLGARAVALVWRDPSATIEDVGGDQPRPHRTRILFYRQFE